MNRRKADHQHVARRRVEQAQRVRPHDPIGVYDGRFNTDLKRDMPR
jgi:hypothetical protein